MSLKIKKASSLLMIFALAACSEQHKLNDQETQKALNGYETTEILFDGAQETGTSLTINSYHLKSRDTYFYKGNLTINGDLPPKTKIFVTNGRLTINGDVGAGSKLSASLPLDTHTEKYSCYKYGYYMGKFQHHFSTNCKKTIVDGLTYPNDSTHNIDINGHIGANVHIRSTTGIEADTADSTAHISSRLGSKADIKYTTPHL